MRKSMPGTTQTIIYKFVLHHFCNKFVSTTANVKLFCSNSLHHQTHADLDLKNRSGDLICCGRSGSCNMLALFNASSTNRHACGIVLYHESEHRSAVEAAAACRCRMHDSTVVWFVSLVSVFRIEGTSLGAPRSRACVVGWSFGAFPHLVGSVFFLLCWGSDVKRKSCLPMWGCIFYNIITVLRVRKGKPYFACHEVNFQWCCSK